MAQKKTPGQMASELVGGGLVGKVAGRIADRAAAPKPVAPRTTQATAAKVPTGKMAPAARDEYFKRLQFQRGTPAAGRAAGPRKQAEGRKNGR